MIIVDLRFINNNREINIWGYNLVSRKLTMD